MAAAEALALLEALRDQVAEVTEHGLRLLRRVRAGRLRTEKGLSLLAVAPQTLLHYLQDLGLLLALKLRGRSLREAPPLPRLLESRVVLEKLRPLERRLKYQVEKLLRAAVTGGRADGDPLSFRPAPGNMAAQEEEEEEEGGEKGPKAPGLGGGRRYVPPRLVPVMDGEEWRQRQPMARRRRALGSSVLRELREELGEEPLELGAGLSAVPPPPDERHRQRLEEALMTRLGRGRRRRAGPEARGGALDTITHFRDMGALLDPANEEAPPPKKRKKPPKGRKRRGRGRRR
ncbi:neuroguidin-like isoform X4 [Athene noctua]|uniref:neuroguidin-like isoform X4 n=1 Tax=Athene noctua TaxID=126797 RepID=UPI003EBC595D